MGRGRSMTTETATMTINASVARTQGRRYQTAFAMPKDEVGIEAGSKGTFSEAGEVVSHWTRLSAVSAMARAYVRRLDALREYKPVLLSVPKGVA